MRRRLGVRTLQEEKPRVRLRSLDRGPGVEQQVRIVPVVDSAEEDERAVLRYSRRPASGAAISPREAFGHSEGNDGEKVLEGGVLRKVRRTDASRLEERARVEEPLLGRSAQKEVGPSERQVKSGPVVPRRLLPERLRVVQVLDREGIVEVDRDGDLRSLVEPVVRGVPRNDRGARAFRGAGEVRVRRREDDRHFRRHFGGLRRVVRNEQLHFELGAENTGELQRANAHPCHPRTDRFRREHGDDRRHPAHRPRTRSRRRCSFQVCEP